MICFSSTGEFVGLMFDETVQPDVRYFFEDIISKLSVFMAQQGTPTVSKMTRKNCFFLLSYQFNNFDILVW